MAYEIIIASDSHGRSDLLEKLEKAYPHAYLYIHCGDLEDNPGAFQNWLFVQGNNDWNPDMPKERVLKLGGHGIYITHSDRLPFRNRKEALAAKAAQEGCDIALYGHTHCSALDKVHNVLEVNPGSLWLPRDGKEPSYARMIIEDDGQVQTELIYQEDWPFDPARKPKKEKKKRWLW